MRYKHLKLLLVKDSRSKKAARITNSKVRGHIKLVLKLNLLVTHCFILLNKLPLNLSASYEKII